MKGNFIFFNLKKKTLTKLNRKKKFKIWMPQKKRKKLGFSSAALG
jgi:hypothetical protein